MALTPPPQVDVRTQEKEPVIDGMRFPKFICEDTIRRIPSMEVRGDDIWLVSYPKSGTHWMKAIIYQIFNYDTPEGSGEREGPLLDEYCKVLDMSSLHSREWISGMPLEEKRYLSAHLLPWFMPKQYVEKKPKTLYITRNPKDIALSLWHFAKKNPWLDNPGSWETHVENFLEGNVIYGLQADHFLSWWNQRNEIDAMFITYEELQKDLKDGVLRISRFLGETVTKEAAAMIAERCAFARMKAISVAKKEHGVPDMMYRQGITGGWKTRFTVAQNERFDAVYKEKLKYVDFKYEYE